MIKKEPATSNVTKTYIALGLMSGTSLDGLDLALCQFQYDNKKWKHAVLKAGTVSYPQELKKRLDISMEMNALELIRLDRDLGKFYADNINVFLTTSNYRPTIIASHGHTIFHQPNERITTQIGNGAIIAAETGITTVCDFRSGDVARGGQGAPLVPIGDQLLFSEYEGCLNLGGFANISLRDYPEHKAFDISPCNMALNYLSQMLGFDYDNNGELARSGHIDATLIHQLNTLEYYQTPAPKSLGKEWFTEIFRPILYNSALSPIDKLATVTEHIAQQIAKAINFIKEGSVLVTGGGAKNLFLLESVKLHTDKRIVVPDSLTIDYKEALIFALLGVLRTLEINNCLHQVTGAHCDSIGGAIYL
ncbi:MAG: anhydro-N-acetylmuramic acid kinase [Bacteroidales bacterium]|nr:anhydro-N-acetylmuramic acid kinase [Bacteroidales bacterium]